MLRINSDIVIQATLNDDFRLADARARLGPKMPFIETIIQQHMSSQLGLGARNIAAVAQKEAFKQQDFGLDSNVFFVSSHQLFVCQDCFHPLQDVAVWVPIFTRWI